MVLHVSPRLAGIGCAEADTGTHRRFDPGLQCGRVHGDRCACDPEDLRTGTKAQVRERRPVTEGMPPAGRPEQPQCALFRHVQIAAQPQCREGHLRIPGPAHQCCIAAVFGEGIGMKAYIADLRERLEVAAVDSDAIARFTEGLRRMAVILRRQRITEAGEPDRAVEAELMPGIGRTDLQDQRANTVPGIDADMVIIAIAVIAVLRRMELRTAVARQHTDPGGCAEG